VQLTSKIQGADSSIEILASTSAGLLTALGFSLGTYQGSDGDITVVVV